MRVGLIGCGAIGATVAQAIVDGRIPGATLVAIASRSQDASAKAMAERAGCPLARSPLDVLETRPSVVVEAASPDAVTAHALPALEAGVDVLVLSVAALADDGTRARLCESATRGRSRLGIPSGAIGGIDVLRACRALDTLHQVTLSTRKAPAALRDAPFVERTSLRVDQLTDAEVVFEGSARDAVSAFPQNVNIAATVSLAGIGFDRTRVRVIADPKASRTVHELEASGSFGALYLRLANVPHPERPRTSWLAALSAIAALQGHTAPIVVGA